MIKPYYQDDFITQYQGHVLEVLPSMASESVQCVMTSPPYWGLRDYGLEPQIWDSQEGCEHEWGNESIKIRDSRNAEENLKATGLNVAKDRSKAQSQTPNIGNVSQGSFCLHCNAWRGSLGLEPSVSLYIQHIIQIFREVKRVLRKDGTCWLNISDTYSGSGGNAGHTAETMNLGRKTFEYGAYPSMAMKRQQNLPAKNLCMIPARVALALQANGWWLRSDIIWSKPNPMPESVKDRPTNSYEHVFLLTKSAKYYWDQDAVREPIADVSVKRAEHGWDCDRPSTKNASMGGNGIHTEKMGQCFVNPAGRNIRNVWTIPTEPTPEAHFATFPKELVRKCILAGSKIGDTVLDPFSGSGKTGIVVKQFSRKAILIELNPEYCEMPLKKIRQGRAF